VDTLHKKNLFSLGEDRYLTTLIMKHFPTFKMKFTPDAIAYTVAPDKWSILISQRRRWINSTIHNLSELLILPEMCGFCLFSMRFIVFVDLLGTIVSRVRSAISRRRTDVHVSLSLDSSGHLCLRK
jgi:chitin synthase